MNTYNQFINDIYAVLSGDYSNHFLAIDEIMEEVPASSDFVIRPSFNFGTSTTYTNLRDYEEDLLINLQIFRNHDSNVDIVEVALDVKNKLKDLTSFVYEGWKFSIIGINLLKNFDTRYTGVTVQIVSRKLEQVEVIPPPPTEEPLTFTSDYDGSTIKLSLIVGTVDNSGLYYRLSKNSEWLKYNFDTEFTLNRGQIVQFKNTNDTFNINLYNYAKFIMTGLFKADGNCNSLINYSNDLRNATFRSLFEYCRSLLTPPKLPGTNIIGPAYYNMFYGCTRLQFAPELPAMSIPAQAYQQMFNGCVTLIETPKLPATSIAANCYQSMFYGCTGIYKAPELPAERLYTSCYQSMFYGCTSLQSMSKIFATNLQGAINCCNSMFAGCTSLTETYPLLAESIGTASYYAMFNGCSSLVKAPEIMATSIPPGQGVQAMFTNCTSLNEIKVHFTAWNATGFTNWVNNVAESGTFICPSALPDERGIARIPENWTKVDIN